METILTTTYWVKQAPIMYDIVIRNRNTFNAYVGYTDRWFCAETMEPVEDIGELKELNDALVAWRREQYRD
jgi:hypothetical protein